MNNWFREHWLAMLAVVLLAGAPLAAMRGFELPFAYFQFMNWSVLGAALWTARASNARDNEVLAWFFVFLAILFNPIQPIYLRTDIWQIADIIVALVFAVTLFFFNGRTKGK
jgi:FtsH-binding integral membrane protein